MLPAFFKHMLLQDRAKVPAFLPRQGEASLNAYNLRL